MAVKNDTPAERATRTFWQGLAVTVIITIASTIGNAVFTPQNIFDGTYWMTIVAAVCVALLMGITSYIQKYFEDRKVAKTVEQHWDNVIADDMEVVEYLDANTGTVVSPDGPKHG